MDFLPGWIFLTRGRALQAVSSSVPGVFDQRLRCRQTGVFLLAAITPGQVQIPGLPGSRARDRMGRLRKTAFRWTRAGVGLRRALYSSRRDLQ